MEIIKTTPIELPVIIAGVYGLRREEVIGIKWNAIDFKDIQIWLGHSNFQTTLRYAHADV